MLDLSFRLKTIEVVSLAAKADKIGKSKGKFIKSLSKTSNTFKSNQLIPSLIYGQPSSTLKTLVPWKLCQPYRSISLQIPSVHIFLIKIL